MKEKQADNSFWSKGNQRRNELVGSGLRTAPGGYFCGGSLRAKIICLKKVPTDSPPKKVANRTRRRKKEERRRKKKKKSHRVEEMFTESKK